MDKNPNSQDRTQYASFSQRLLAQNIDILIYLALAYGLSFLVTDDLLFYSLIVLIIFIYNTAFEMSGWNGTIGKKLVKLQVLASDDENNISKIFMRNALKFFSLLLLFGGFVMINLNNRRQALHDKISGSVVVFA